MDVESTMLPLGTKMPNFNLLGIDGKNYTNEMFNGKIGSQFNWQLNWSKVDITSDYDNSFPLEDADFEFSTNLNRYGLNTQYKYTNGSLNLNAGLQKNKREYRKFRCK